MKKIIVLFALIALVSCTENDKVKNWGGTAEIKLDASVRLVHITWKDDDIWMLTKKDTTKPTTYSFKQKSSFNTFKGEYIIKEQ